MTDTASRATTPAASGGPLTDRYDTALLDLDGVVYVGAEAVPGAPEAIAAARAAGMRVAYVTNNASRPPSAVAAQLTALGVAAAGSDVVTSAQAAARVVADKATAGAPVLVVGGAGLVEALRELDLRPVDRAEDEPVAVVQGFSRDLTYAQLAEGAVAIRAGALFVASNLDRTLPSERGPLPGNGSLVEVLRLATGVDPVVAGKPEPPLHQEAVRRTGARRPLVVGDRLDTDIEGAHRGGSDSLLVLTGLTDAADLLAAPPVHRPTYVASDLRGLRADHPAPRPADRGWTCGGWTASVVDGALHLDGDGAHDDGLRALCASAWSAAAPPESDVALARLDRPAG